MQLSNVPEVRTARHLLAVSCVLFGLLFLLNLATTWLAFTHDDSDRWLNVARLVPNLVVPVLIWRGYVVLAALAERATIYKQALEEGLPKLEAAVRDRRGPGEPQLDTGLLRAGRAAAPRPDGRPASG